MLVYEICSYSLYEWTSYVADRDTRAVRVHVAHHGRRGPGTPVAAEAWPCVGGLGGLGASAARPDAPRDRRHRLNGRRKR